MRYRPSFLFLLCLILILTLSVACSSSDDDDSEAQSIGIPTTSQRPQENQQAMPFKMMSPAFGAGQAIPPKYSCDGDDISPPLVWVDPPQGTQSFALICDDPDASGGTWDHWIIYNLPKEVRAFPENGSVEPPEGILHGKNSFGRNDYGGPCPPSDIHRYFFRLYALDTPLDLAGGASKTELLQAMEGNILGEAETMGTYSR